MTTVDGAVAVVTGGGSGIGRATAHSLARRGATVVVADIDEARAETVAAEVGGTGVRVDVTAPDDLARLRDVTLRRHGRVDIVMNNVGVLAVGLPLDIPLEAWQRVLDVNLLSVVRSNEVFLPLLLAQGHGHVVNTASTAGLLAYAYDRLPYAASKAAVIALSEGLALYLHPLGVRVSCFCPSGVLTNIVEQVTAYGEPRTPSAPLLPIIDAETAGELVADGIAEDRFLIVTAPEVHDMLVRKATDVDAYLAAQS